MEEMTYADLRQQWEDDSPCITAYTSGSTGTPKRISLPKDMMRRSAQRTISYFGINAGSRLYSCISPQFIGGKMMLIRALVARCEFEYEQPSNRPQIGECSYGYDLVSVVPSQMRHILQSPQILARVKNFLIGGSAIPPQLRKAIADAGIAAYESYGMTETASHIALRRIGMDDKPFSVLPGISLSADERGCLVIDMSIDGTVVTNDIVEFADEAKNKFYILGRVDDVIVTGGMKVHPAQAEKLLSPLFPDMNICLTSCPDALWGSRVILLVETESLADADNIKQRMRELLPPHCIPKEIIAVKSLPRTSSGKVIRRQLTEQLFPQQKFKP